MPTSSWACPGPGNMPNENVVMAPETVTPTYQSSDI